ncbi:MAG: T9SS type A sorting domain-containing protein [Bacteroidota bacterium]
MCLSCTAFAQFGITKTDSLIWQIQIYGSSSPTGPGQGPTYFNYFYNYFINGDTVINGYPYKKLYKFHSEKNVGFTPQTATFSNTVYEENNKVYMGKKGNSIIIQDYNLTVGDYFQFNGVTDYTSHKVTSIDSVYLVDKYIKRFTFNNRVVWIKGIGDVTFGHHFDYYGFLNFPNLNYNVKFLCYSEIENKILGNNCFYAFTGNNEIEKENESIKMYPNPFDDKINFNTDFLFKNWNSNYSIINQIGEVIYHSKLNSISIDTKEINPGLYFLIIESKDTKYSYKILKH